MIAQRFRPLGWAAGVATAVTGLYLVSLQVAAERGRLEAVERQISEAKQSLRALQTELGTRASLRQLEAWNGEVLALSAPKAGQFAADPIALTALDLDPETDIPGDEAPRALLATAMTAPAIVAAVVPAPAPTAKVKPETGETAKVAATAPKPRTDPSKPVRVADARSAAKPAKAHRVAMLDDRTMREVARAASREGRPRP